MTIIIKDDTQEVQDAGIALNGILHLVALDVHIIHIEGRTDTMTALDAHSIPGALDRTTAPKEGTIDGPILKAVASAQEETTKILQNTEREREERKTEYGGDP